MFRKKSWLKVVLVLLIVTLTCGCATTAKSPSQDSQSVKEPVSTKSDEVRTVKLILPGPASEEEFYKEKIAEFEAKNEGIKCEVLYTPNEADAYGNAVQLMFSSNDAPDIIRVSASFPTGMLASYAKGWLHPLDEFLTPEFTKTFPDGSFEKNGGLMLDGEIYGLPFIAAEFPAFRPMIYNMTLLKEYGITSPAKSWDELKTILETVKEKSNGKVYGFGLQAKDGGAYAFSSLGETIRTDTADLNVTEGNFLYNFKTGMSNAANEGSIAAVEFIKELNKEGLMIPGWETAGGDTMMQYIATGKVAVLSGMSYWPKNILDINPDIELKLTPPVTRSENDNGRRYIYSVCDPYYGMGSNCKYPEETWKVMQCITSLEFQEEFIKLTGRVTVGFRAFPEGTLLDYMQENMDNASNYLRVAPNPANTHPDATKLISNILANAPKPTLNELYLLSVANDVSFEELAKKYDTEMDSVVDEQIKKMQSEGSSITRNDLIFPDDWNMDQNYNK